MSPCSRILRRNLPSQLLLRVPLLGTSHSNTICSCPWVRSAPAAQHLPTPSTPTRHHAHACATRSAPPTNHSCAAAAHACCLTCAPGPLRASLLTPSYSPPPGSRTCCVRTRPARHCSLGAARIQHIRAVTTRCHTGSLLLTCRHAASFAPAPLGSRAAHASVLHLPREPRPHSCLRVPARAHLRPCTCYSSSGRATHARAANRVSSALRVREPSRLR
jgi:hypothetical protein